MSANINLEIAGDWRKDELYSALSVIGFVFESEPNGLAMQYIGFFERSGMRALYVDKYLPGWRQFAAGSSPLTEGIEVQDWIIEARLTFCYRNSEAEQCDADIRDFSNALALRSRGDFVVSYEYEKIYAIKAGDRIAWMF